MSGDEKGYNGWSNYETWLVALWMDNEACSADYWQETAQEVYNRAEASATFTKDEQAALDLSSVMKDTFEEQRPDVTGLWADMINAAMSEVNWYEIAEHKIADVDKEPQ